MDCCAHGWLIEPGCRAGAVALVGARGVNVVRVKTLVEGREVGEGGGVGCAADATRGVDRRVDESGCVWGVLIAGDLAFLFEEVEAFGVPGDLNFAFWGVGELIHDLVETALVICAREGGEDGLRDFEVGGFLTEVRCCYNIGHRGGVAEGWIAQDDGFQIDIEEASVRNKGFGEVRDLWLPWY